MATYFDGEKLDAVVKVEGSITSTTVVYEVPPGRYSVVEINYYSPGGGSITNVTETNGSTVLFAFDNSNIINRVSISTNTALERKLVLVAGQKIIQAATTSQFDLTIKEFIAP